MEGFKFLYLFALSTDATYKYSGRIQKLSEKFANVLRNLQTLLKHPGRTILTGSPKYEETQGSHPARPSEAVFHETNEDEVKHVKDFRSS